MLVRQAEVFDEVAVLVDGIISRQRLSPGQVQELLQCVMSVYQEVMEDGGIDQLGRRGGDSGPWDVTEKQVGKGYVRLGGLFVPDGADVVLKPMPGTGREVIGVTVVSGRRTAIQLQAFRASADRPWAQVRSELMEKLSTADAGPVEHAAGAGYEIRAQPPVRRPDGQVSSMSVRFLGCDGPGWMLRGVVTGQGAAPNSREQWPYEVFNRTIVDVGLAGPGESAPVLLHWDGWA